MVVDIRLELRLRQCTGRMTNRFLFSRQTAARVFFILWLALLVCSSWGQTPQPQPPNNQPPPTGSEGINTTQGQKISPKEAEELFHSVDEILQFASKDTDFPIK